MIKLLLEEVFEKLMLENDNDNRTTNGCFKFFNAEILEKRYNAINIVSDRTLIDYYKKHVEGKNNNTGEPSSEVKNYMAQYLGYENYSTFEIDKKTEPKPLEKNMLNSNYKFTMPLLLIAAIVIIGLTIQFYPTEEKKCISWEKDHYVKVDCNPILNSSIEIDQGFYNIENVPS